MNDVSTKRCANSSGRALEKAVGAWLSSFCIDFNRNAISGSRNCMGNVIHPDFTCPNVDDGVYIECRRQESSGSAEKKSPAILTDATEGRYGKPVIVVVSGKSSEATYEFFKERECSELRCMNMDEFFRFCEEASQGTWTATPRAFDTRQGLFSFR